MRRDRKRRTPVAAVTTRDDPYAAYLAWIGEGRPSLGPADLLLPIPIPAADDVPEDAIGGRGILVRSAA
jgi:hypothetical protein